MKKLIYIGTLIIFIILIVFSQNVIFASMADYTDEQADENLKQEQEEFKKEQEEKINKSSNNYLKNLSVKGYSITPEFDKQTINYEITQEITDDNIEIKTETYDEKASVLGNGKITLNSGENNIKIDVTAENGMVRSYFIKIVKSIKKDVRLNSLKLSTDENVDIEITPEFDSSIFEYNCNIQNYIEKLNIETTSNLENAKIEIIGNENLQEGLNQILINVSLNDEEKVVYKINAFKEKEQAIQLQDKKNEIEYKVIIAVLGGIILLIAIIITILHKLRRK